MDQYAIWFFTMLDEAYKLQAEETGMQAHIALIPHMKDGDRKRFFRTLGLMNRDIMDIGKDKDDYSGLEKLKGEFKK